MENDYDARMTELDRRIEESRKRLDEQQQRGIESLLGGSASSTVVPSISKYRRLGSRASGLDGYAERVADFLYSVPGTMYSVLKSDLSRLYSGLNDLLGRAKNRRVSNTSPIISDESNDVVAIKVAISYDDDGTPIRTETVFRNGNPVSTNSRVLLNVEPSPDILPDGLDATPAEFEGLAQEQQGALSEPPPPSDEVDNAQGGNWDETI